MPPQVRRRKKKGSTLSPGVSIPDPSHPSLPQLTRGCPGICFFFVVERRDQMTSTIQQWEWFGLRMGAYMPGPCNDTIQQCFKHARRMPAFPALAEAGEMLTNAALRAFQIPAFSFCRCTLSLGKGSCSYSEHVPLDHDNTLKQLLLLSSPPESQQIMWTSY